MTAFLCALSFIAGLGAMGLYALTHGSEVQKLGVLFSGEFVKVKADLAKVVAHIEGK